MYFIAKRALVKKDYKELDEAIKSKIPPWLYNNGQGKKIPIAQLTLLRNRDRPKSKQVAVMGWNLITSYNLFFAATLHQRARRGGL